MTVDNSFTMKKFQSMEIIYVTFSQITKLPYVECDPETFDDQVYMFTEEEAAKEFAKSYVEKNTPLLTVKVLRKQMPNFYMGLQVSCIGQQVQVYDLIIRVFVYHVMYEVSADKSGSACY